MWKYHMILSSRKIEKWERTYFAREKIDHTSFLLLKISYWENTRQLEIEKIYDNYHVTAIAYEVQVYVVLTD